MARIDYDKWRQEQILKYGVLIPHVSPYIRGFRESKLRDAGLLPFERRWLVSHKLNTPAMKSFLKERRNIYRAAKQQGKSWTDYDKQIRSWYKAQGWTFKNGQPNPFRMFDAFKKRHDQPDTPQPKHRRVKKPYPKK